MYLSSFRVTNYKSFLDSGKVHLEPGFNVIVGQNNTGKTALTQALSLRFSSNPHRSTTTIRSPGTSPDSTSCAEVAFHLDTDDVKELLRDNLSTRSYYVAAGPDGQGDERLAQTFLDLVSEGPTIEATFVSQQNATNSDLRDFGLRGYGGTHGHGREVFFEVDSETGELTYLAERNGSNAPQTSTEFAAYLAQMCRERIYVFGALRFGVQENVVGPGFTLNPDAGNLVQVLNLLYNTRPNRWRKYLEGVRTVLPQIKDITFSPSTTQQGAVGALIWHIDPETNRDDLAVSIADSGTGVGQVLAMLYLAFSAEHPTIIVIDEPQCFLPPGAVRKLFEILKEYPQHQYVITTHSPNAVTAADPNALLVVRKEDEESVIEEIDAATAHQQERLLREVGATLSDVFGADNVLWVEGATEEECFPIIITKLLRRRLLGTRVIGVAHTSDFERKHMRTALSIYIGLSEVKGILPPTLGFVFDRETRSDKERQELEDRSGGRATLTSRRTYENYLINPKAIAYVASQTEGFREGEGVSAEEIESWIDEHRWEVKYFDAQVEDSAQTEHFWLAEVHGAKFLEDMFFELSKGCIAYDKVAHGAALTRWLCGHAPKDLEELARLIEDRLDNHERPPGR